MFKSLKGSLMNFVNSINLCGQQHNTPPQTPQRYKLGNRTIQEEHLLSEGGYGYVWQAFDVKTKEEFAVKKMLCQVLIFSLVFKRKSCVFRVQKA